VVGALIQITIEGSFTPQASKDIVPFLTPVPQHVQPGTGSLIFSGKSTITFAGKPEPAISFQQLLPSIDVDPFPDPDWDLETFAHRMQQIIDSWLEELGLPWRIENDAIVVDTTEQVTIEVPEQMIPLNGQREGYALQAAQDKVTISAWTFRGAYYGVTTFLQLVHVPVDATSNSAACPELVIYDYPQYHARGLIDDISRGQRPTINNIKKFIRFLSRGKQNIYVLYIEDIIHFKSHPSIGEGRGKLMPEDLREIQDYAKEWFVCVIPGIELLGHMENILLVPEYMKYAEFPGAACLDITNPETKEFVKELLDDAIPLFDSPVFAPICDESSDFGLGKTAGIVKEKGYGNALAEWYSFLIEEIRKRGKPIVFFAHDIAIKFPEALEVLKKSNAMVYCWIYSNAKKYPAVTKLRQLGLTTAAGPAVFDWSRHYPYFEYAEANMINYGKDAAPRGAIGLITTKWGDFHNENLRENIYYGLQVNAQASWTPFQSKPSQIRSAFAWHFFGTKDARVLECMDILAKQNRVLPRFPNGMFNRFWLDPFVRNITSKEHAIAKQFMIDARHVLGEIERMREEGTIKLNQDNLDYMAFAARMALHYGAKILISEAASKGLSFLATFAKGRAMFDGDPVLDGFKWLRTNCDALRDEYRILWQRQAVVEGLDNPTHRFDVLAWYYEQAIADMGIYHKPYAHQLKSDWIWIPGRRTSATWGNKQWQYFTKEFTIQGPFKRVRVQGMSANHLRIAVNGHDVGEVVARSTLGYLPWIKAVTVFDISGFVHEGSNVICAEAVNWGGGVGSLNIIIHVDHDDGMYDDIYTNKTWYCSIEKPEIWPFESWPRPEGIAGFKHARSLGKPPFALQGPISEPIWSKDWKSSISFTFGYRNMIESAVPMFAGERIYNAIFWLFPGIMHLFGSDIYGLRKNRSTHTNLAER